MKNRIIVVGGGAAGMLAAATAASRGLNTILFEKNEKLGKKIYLTGKGRCNVTNDCSPDDLIRNTPGNGSFLYSAAYSFGPDSIRDILHSMGVPTKVERGRRVFPVSDKSSDVIKALERYMKLQGVNVKLNTEVSALIARNGRIEGVRLKGGGLEPASSVIVATGGLSYPATGSTGDGYRWAKGLGHTIKQTRPSLVPVETVENWVKDVQGLSLRNVSVSAVTAKGGRIVKEFGELMFTHFGVSGPVILTISRFIYDYIDKGVKLRIDLKPALDIHTLDRRVVRDLEKYSNKLVRNALDDLLPKGLIPMVIEKSGIDPDTVVHQVTREQRKGLLQAIKSFELSVKGLRPIEEAVITAGGVSTTEVNPSTMESNIVKGLYFAGEVLDVDALTGGYNLQIAFSTGYLAGACCG
jgi:predicted Rossmann fold flavoprotein